MTSNRHVARHRHEHAFTSFNALEREGLVLTSRRNMLKASLAGIAGLTMADLLRKRAEASPTAPGIASNKSVILLWMTGGPSHIDTFDLKYNTETATEFKPIATSVPGLQISEHLPRIAQHMHHGAVIRGMNTVESDHDRGRYLMHTGYPRSNGGVAWPSIGALVSSELGQPGFLLPNFVVCNLQDRLDPTFTGYLPPRHRGLILPDLNKGIELRPARTSSYVVFAASLALTALFGWRIW